MFENETSEKILQQLLNSVTANVDKRQGSIIYDSLAAQSIIMAYQFQQAGWLADKVIFPDTSQDEYLDRFGDTFGVERRPATPAIREIAFTGVSLISDGERFFSPDGLYWIYNSTGNNVSCETAGAIGNTTLEGSKLVPVNNIAGLTSATLGTVIKDGVERENDNALRERILSKMKNPELNSNAAQIKAWCKEIVGVGDVRVFPLWNGVNTVKAVIIDTDKQPASTSITKQVQQYIEPYDLTNPTLNRGLGEGKADIGCIFTAAAATALPINVDFKVLVLSTGKTVDDAKTDVEEGLKIYLEGLAFGAEKKKDIVRIQEIGAMLLNTSSIIDFEGLTLNGNNANIEVELDSVATVGTVTVRQ